MWPNNEFQICKVEGKLEMRIVCDDTMYSVLIALLETNNIKILKTTEPVNDQGEIIFPGNQYWLILTAFKNNKMRLGLLPREIYALWKIASVKGALPTDKDPVKEALPTELFDQLKPYQKEGIRFVHDKGGRAIIADEMGVGKTLQAIASCLLYKKFWPVLIVCPKSLGPNWREEIQRWIGVPRENIMLVSSTDSLETFFGEELKPQKQKKRKTEGVKKENLEFLIISYDLLVKPKVMKVIEERKFNIMICDESHYIKNIKSKRSLSVSKLCCKTPHVILLSGTPSSSPEQMYPQMRALQPDLFPPFWIPPKSYSINTHEKVRAMNYTLPCSYASRWCDPLPQKTFANRFEWITSGTCRGEEFHALGSYFFFIRRTKAEVLQGMPEKIREKIVFEVPEKERLEIAQKTAEMKAIKEKQPKMFKVMYMEQYHDLPRIKAPFSAQYLEYLLTDGDMGSDPTLKCLLFAHHGEVMRNTLATVNKHKLKSIFIDGGTKERHDLVQDFQTNPETRVAVLSMTAAGTGLNLFAASLIIFLEMFPNPAILTQCEARAHRLGAKKNVVIRYLVAHETLDESLWRVVQRKENNQGLLLEGKSTPFKTDNSTHVELKEEKGEEEEILEL